MKEERHAYCVLSVRWWVHKAACVVLSLHQSPVVPPPRLLRNRKGNVSHHVLCRYPIESELTRPTLRRYERKRRPSETMRPRHTPHSLPAFPVYSCAFLSPDAFVLGGGGGASRSGIKNKLVRLASTTFRLILTGISWIETLHR
jgi:hypothetical protein